MSRRRSRDYHQEDTKQNGKRRRKNGISSTSTGTTIKTERESLVEKNAYKGNSIEYKCDEHDSDEVATDLSDGEGLMEIGTKIYKAKWNNGSGKGAASKNGALISTRMDDSDGESERLASEKPHVAEGKQCIESIWERKKSRAMKLESSSESSVTGTEDDADEKEEEFGLSDSERKDHNENGTKATKNSTTNNSKGKGKKEHRSKKLKKKTEELSSSSSDDSAGDALSALSDVDDGDEMNYFDKYGSRSVMRNSNSNGKGKDKVMAPKVSKKTKRGKTIKVADLRDISGLGRKSDDDEDDEGFFDDDGNAADEEDGKDRQEEEKSKLVDALAKYMSKNFEEEYKSSTKSEEQAAAVNSLVLQLATTAREPSLNDIHDDEEVDLSPAFHSDYEGVTFDLTKLSWKAKCSAPGVGALFLGDYKSEKLAALMVDMEHLRHNRRDVKYNFTEGEQYELISKHRYLLEKKFTKTMVERILESLQKHVPPDLMSAGVGERLGSKGQRKKFSLTRPKPPISSSSSSLSSSSSSPTNPLNLPTRTRYHGIRLNETTGKWEACFDIMGRVVPLKESFDLAVDAAKAFDKEFKKMIANKEFPMGEVELNFPEDP